MIGDKASLMEILLLVKALPVIMAALFMMPQGILFCHQSFDNLPKRK
jgi:hypothetical protein